MTKARLDPAVDGIQHTRDEVYGWLTQPRACPYQLLYDRRAFAIRAPRGDVLAVLREYEQARADLKATKLDLAKFASYRDFALEKFRLSSRTIPVAPPLIAGEAEYLAMPRRHHPYRHRPHEGPMVRSRGTAGCYQLLPLAHAHGDQAPQLSARAGDAAG